MRNALRLLAAMSVIAIAGCNTTNTRIQEHAAEFASLAPATQRAIRRGVVEPGFTTDMVYMALGKPAEVTTAPSGETVWLYREYPVTATNETIMAGYRRRVVFDPAKGGNDIIVEPIDTKAFPNLVPHTLRFTFRDNRVVSIERLDRV